MNIPNGICAIGKKGCFTDGKCYYNRNCENKVVTNADRIRAMSDEELAGMLNRIIICHQLRLDGWYCSKCPLYGAKPCDTEGIIDWLKEPAKDGEDE